MTEFKVSDSLAKAHLKAAEKRIDTKIQLMKEAGLRQDAISFSKSQLEAMESTIYNVLYSNPRDAFVLLPLNASVPDGATEYSYRMLSELGQANVVADGATDRNFVDADLTKYNKDIIEFGSGYTFTVGDSARGGVLDFSYVQEKARIAAERIAVAHSDWALKGSAAGIPGAPSGVEGFFNQSSVTPTTLTDEDWSAVTGSQMYASISDLIRAVLVQSSGVHEADTVVLSTSIYAQCSTTPLNDAGSSKTVLSALRENHPGVTFLRSASADGIGAGGDDRCVAYERRSDRLEYVASVVYDEATPDKAGFRFSVQSRGRAAGTVVRYPLSMAYGDIAL